MQLVKKSLRAFFDSLRILRAVSEHEPRDLHGGDLQDRAAGHHIEPELPHFLRSGDRRGDRGDDDQQRTGTADDGRNGPGAQLPSMVCWMVLSSPSRAAAKQQTTRPNTSRSSVLLPQQAILPRFQTETPM
mgnify:CR=1 FL=1